MPYTTRQVGTLFGVVNETVRNWTIEFGEYLSPTSKPGRNKNRFYTVEDLEVLSLVSELRKQGMNNAEIHVALKSGERGQAPVLEPGELQLIASGGKEKQLSLEIEHLQHSLVKLQSELAEARALAAEAQTLKEENIRLTTTLDQTQKQLEETKTEKDQHIQELQQRLEEKIQQLSKEAGEAYTKGFIEALERQGEVSAKPD